MLTYQEACDLVKVLQKIGKLRTAVIGAWQSDRRQLVPIRMREHIAHLRTQLARQRKLLDAADKALDQAEARL